MGHVKLIVSAMRSYYHIIRRCSGKRS